MNSYKLEAEDAITVVDKLVNADLIAATSTEELATAFQYSASFASAAGVSFDKMVGMLTTASETTRLSAETVGQAFKSMFSRLQNVKAGKSIDDQGEAINDSEKVLKRYNITLRDSATEFRNLEDVLDDVGRRWNEFDTVEQAQIATAIAGVHQRNTFIAVMQNYDKVLEYTNKTMEASGTSAQKYTHYMSSLEAKINELTVQWEQFIQGLNQSGTIKIGVSLLSGLLKVLDDLAVKMPVLQGALGTFLAFKALRGLPAIISSLGKSFKGLSSNINRPIRSLKQTVVDLKSSWATLDTIISKNGETLSAYEKQQIAVIVSSKALNAEKKTQKLVDMGLTTAQAQLLLSTDAQTAANMQAIISNNSLTESQKQGKIAAILFAMAKKNNIQLDQKQTISLAGTIAKQKTMQFTTQGLTAAMSTLNLVLGIVSIAISGIATAIMSARQAAEEARDNAIETINTYNDTSSSIDELIEKYKNLKKEYDSISDTSLKNEKAEELLTIRDQIVETYGSEADGIDIVNGKLETTLTTLKQIAQQRASETWTDISDEVATAFDYEKSIGFWNYGDVTTGKAHGAVTQIGDRATAIKYSDVIDDLWSEINRLGGEINPANMALMFGSESYFQTVENIKQLLTTIDEKISSGEITKENQETYQNFRDMLSQEIRAIESDTEYQQNKQILENAKDIAIDSLSKTFTEGDYAGQTVREVLDQYTEITSQMNALASSGEVNEETYNDLKTVADNLLQTLSTATGLTSNERIAELVGRSITEAGQEFEKSQQKAQANIVIAKAVESSGLSEKIKGMFATDIKQTQDKEITDLLGGIRESLKDKDDIDMSISEIVDSLELLGYTYQKTEKLTAEGVISGFSTDEKAITNAIDNIDKLNNAVKNLSMGTIPDLSELSELKTASIDITNLTQGGLDNVAKIEAVRDDYVQSILDTLDEQINVNNEIIKTDKSITDEEKRQIENENKLNEIRKQAIQNAVDGVKTTANEYITAIKSAGELIAEVAGYGDRTISEDILSSMVDQYSGMASIVEKYRLGMIDNDELLKAFKQFYNNDIDNFYDYQQKKYMESNQYYSDWLDKNSDFVEEFKTQYGIDLKNAQNYAEAKALILGGDMYKYIDASTGELTQEGLRITISPMDRVDSEISNQIKDAQKKIQALINKYDSTAPAISINVDESLNAQLDVVTSRMKDAYTLLHELGQEGSQITLDTLDSMKSAYPAMTEYIDKYIRKEMTRQELISKFKSLYEEDKNNYINIQAQKLSGTDSFYSNLLEENDDWVKEFKKDYALDLKNFTNLMQAKQTIIKMFNEEQEYVGTNFEVSDYINLMTGEYTEQGIELMKQLTNATSTAMTKYNGLAQTLIELHALLSKTTEEATKDVEDTADTIEDLIAATVYSVEDALSDVSTVLSKQVEYYEDIANGIVAAAQLEIDALDKEIDLLDKKNEAQQRQIALQEKLEALNKAKTQRSVREYNAETGQFEWTTNKKDIKKAQEEYDQQVSENKKQSLEDEKEWYEKYGESFTNVSETMQNQRDIQSALNWLAQYRGVDVSTLSSKDLLSLSEKEQSAFRSAYGRAVDVNLGFEDAQSQKETRKAQANLVSGGYATNGKAGFAFNWEAITNALGSSITTLASTLDKYTEILKPTSFAETKPTTNAVTNITNTGEVKNSYTFTGDMEFKFDKDVDADNFISKFVSKLQMQNGITTVK